MKRHLLFTLYFSFFFFHFSFLSAQAIRVSDNGRFLQYADGTPFFYMGDTAWELFHRLNREEADEYLCDRAAKGFNVIQCVALAELDGVGTPNAYGHLPLIDRDPSRPLVVEGEANDYWDHVDYIVHRANELGLTIALLPTWGRWWHDGDAIFDELNAYRYGRFLGERYRTASVIWVLGGDRNPENDTHRTIMRALASGLSEGDGGTHLITYHPGGAWSSADFYHGEEWLDFNMRQNGHHHLYDLYRKTSHGYDYDHTPVKPVLDGEPIYEDHPVAFDAAHQGHSVAADVRRALYWDLFGGACGHTYGHHSIWQMYDPAKGDGINNPLMSWREALQQPGSSQIRHGRDLILSRPYYSRIPATGQVLVSGPVETAWPGQGLYRFAATADADSTWLMVYAPAGRTFTVRTSYIKGRTLKVWWYDPRTGEAHRIGRQPNRGTATFVTPTPGEMTDWILVIDDAAARYPKPGHLPKALRRTLPDCR